MENTTQIADQVELFGERGLFNIHQDKNNKNTFYAENMSTGELSIYKTTKDIELIKEHHRDEILHYCIGRFTPDDIVTDKDVFIHNEYLRKS